MTGYPAADGFRAGAAWQPHDRCFMAWPSRIELWGEQYEQACLAFASAVRAVARFEPVTLLTPPRFAKVAKLQLPGAVTIVEHDLEDCWLRDMAPAFVHNDDGDLAAVSFHFNAWGNRYHNYAHDAELGEWFAETLDLRHYRCPMVLEAGAIELDGDGTLIASREAILGQNRNPTLDQRQVEERLALHLGVRKIIWLDGGLAGDALGGHVCNVARFLAPGVVACAVVADRDHPDHGALAGNLADLAASRDATGRQLEIVEVPLPLTLEGAPLPGSASYLSFVLAGGGLLLPSFDVAQDDIAAGALAQVWPQRRQARVPASELFAAGAGLCSLVLGLPGSGDAAAGDG